MHSSTGLTISAEYMATFVRSGGGFAPAIAVAVIRTEKEDQIGKESTQCDGFSLCVFSERLHASRLSKCPTDS